MRHLNVSACHSLKLYPVSILKHFARIDSNVQIMNLESPIDAEAVPGSLKVSASDSDGLIKKKSLTAVHVCRIQLLTRCRG